MKNLHRVLAAFLLFLLPFASTSALAWEDEGDFRAPTPPRLSLVDGQVSYWREGAEDWVGARRNLALSEGDALYTGKDSSLEIQFDSRSFVRADADTQLMLLNQEERYIHFKLTRGLASFDIRSIEVGNSVEVSTPDAVFVIEHPGYYRVEVNSRDTHFITRRGGRATVTMADGRALSIYPSEDILVTGGNPVQVATYAAPQPDGWDRWNDERSDRIGESVSTRYLPPDVYGAEDLDHHGHWRVVPEYGPVWIPRAVAPDWAPYSTGSWVWDPFYEWTWVDDAPWGWAPFHYGRWVHVGSYWAWAPGPVVRRAVYSPALVAFLIRDHDVSLRVSAGLPGLWWVALSWGEPVLPWWGHPRHRWHPRWAGWGGPRVVNNVVINQTTIINERDIRHHNARQPRAIFTVPPDKFGREHFKATAETRYRHEEFAPVRGEMPLKPSRASLHGGAPKAAPPPREVVNRPVVSTRPPRERTLPWQDEAARARVQPQVAPEQRYVKLPERREDDRPSRPPFGAEAGPERTPPPQPPRLRDVAKPAPVTRSQAAAPPQQSVRSEASPRAQSPAPKQATVATKQQVPAVVAPLPPRAAAPSAPASRPAPAAQRQSPERVPDRTLPQHAGARQEDRAQPLPGKPANQTYRGQDGKAHSWEQRSGR